MEPFDMVDASHTHNVPSIETERLLLRAHRRADFEASFAMWSDPGVTQYIGGKPSTEQQAWSRMLAYAGLWAHVHYGYWAVEERHSGAFVGEVGFADFKRNIDPAMRDVPEAGWAFAPRAHGRGYATEAVRAALAWLDALGAFPRTVCMIDPANGASIRVADKCGFSEFRRDQYLGSPTLFFERTATTAP